MKKIIFCFLCLLQIFTCQAQSAEGRYVSRMTQDGTLFFINPHKLKELKGIKKFDYDVTLLSWTDSLTINFTFESNEMTIPSEVKIQSGKKYFICDNFSPLFIDIKKNHYEIRITTKFSNSEFEEIITSPLPPSFIMIQDGKEESASYKVGEWKRESKILKDIYRLYLYSR